MQKKCIIRLSDAECEILRDVVKKLGGSSQKMRRAQILLKADADGSCWTDQQIADTFGCRRQTVKSIRYRLVVDRFEMALDGKRPEAPPRSLVLCHA